MGRGWTTSLGSALAVLGCATEASTIGAGADVATAVEVVADATVGADAGPDLASPEVSVVADVALLDAPLSDLANLSDAADVAAADTADTATDAGPDTPDVPDVPDVPPLPKPKVEADGVMFRVDGVLVKSPPLCLVVTAGDPCADVSALINAYIGSHLTGNQALDIVGFFKPFELLATGPNKIGMSFGRGDCLRDGNGEVIACGFWGDPTYFENTTVMGPGNCTVFNAPEACYSTTTAPGLVLDLGGVPLGFTEAFTAGQFTFDDKGTVKKLQKAYVQGFMTKETAEKTTITVQGFGDLTIASMLSANDMSTDAAGNAGWYFEIDYTASRVPIKF